MRTGRPKFEDPADVRNVTLRFRCTDGEETEFKRRAARDGLTLSDWMRKRLLDDGSEGEEPPAVETDG